MAEDFAGLLESVLGGKKLSRQEASSAILAITDGVATQAQIVSFLSAIKERGESVDEIIGFATAMRSRACSVHPKKKPLLDTCGTGGDGSGTFNISTTVAFIAAGAGAAVAKHGNRSVSSRCGSADVLEALGVKVDLSPEKVAAAIDACGVGFLFAPALHPAMKSVAAARRQIKARTVFNLLGPLLNPAGAKRQLLGVYSIALVETVAEALRELGAEEAVVVSAEDGLDEFSLGAVNVVAHLRGGKIEVDEFDAAVLGFKPRPIEDLAGGDAPRNAEITLSVLRGEKGAPREVCLLNAAWAIMAAGLAKTVEEGLKAAEKSIDSGAALKALESLKKISHD